MSQPRIVPSIAELRAMRVEWRRAGESVALIPTMGALHEGHIALVELGRQRAKRTVVSIFVNPAQFGPNEDFLRYPRTFEADRLRLAEVGADTIFAPTPETMYPAGFATTVSLAGPATAGLEDRFRPTHFAGVATIVAKLLIQAAPDFAIFGEKDFQQLAVIRRMARDLDLPGEIVGAPTIREPDGLAMSSRNVYLATEERAAAPTLHRAMQTAAAEIRLGEKPAAALAAARKAIAQAGFALDYLELRDAANLAPVEAVGDAPLRLLVAARIGKTRLIDNIGV